MPSDLEITRRLRDDFTYYSPRALRIRTKSGAIEKFRLNRAQQYLHDRVEEQRAATGKVRALVLKGRQQGISTYIEGRFYWKVTHRNGVQAFILTHEQQATDNLFKMVARYHDHCPAVIKPQTHASNAKELVFGNLDSGYKLGTAGTKGTGRSATIQYFHGSEAAFWPHADEHAAGVMQAIPSTEGTEVFLESTANGTGNYFHRMWQQAEAGLSEYIAVFIPWFWQPEYRLASDDFHPTEEEAEYGTNYGLDAQQLAWMRGKVAEFNGDRGLFDQEYPATAAIAFQYSKTDSLIPADAIIKARRCKIENPEGAIVAGLDPARFGDDRTALVIRKGRKVIHMQTWSGKDTMEVVGFLVKAKQEFNIDMAFIDVGGLGAGVVDRLRELGHRDWTRPVNSGEKPSSSDYYNKRAEMWGLMKEWLLEPPVQLPDSDELQADLMAPGYTYDSHTRLKLESKDDIKKRGLRSPDLGDALAQTFAFPYVKEKHKPIIRQPAGSAHAWMGF